MFTLLNGGGQPLASPAIPPSGFIALNQDFYDSRESQAEVSLMTSRPDGKLTVNPPGSSPDGPPAIIGARGMTGLHAFHCRLKDPLLVGGTMVNSIQMSVHAHPVRPSAGVGGSFWITSAEAPGFPLPGQDHGLSPIAFVGGKEKGEGLCGPA